MKILLYTEAPPSGRALLVAKALCEATGRDLMTCAGIITALFACKYTDANPIDITTLPNTSLDTLIEQCEKVDIKTKVIQ